MTCCNNINVIEEDGFNVCINCGNIGNQVYVIHDFYINREIYNMKQNIYKRCRYFLKKLDLITLKAKYNPLQIYNVIEKIENYNFDTIHELKTILCKNKVKNGIKKHIYRIYFEIKQKKAVIITNEERQKLKQMFFYFEKHFRIKYMNNYNIIIHNFLKMIGNNYYKNIVLPVLSVKNINEYKNHF